MGMKVVVEDRIIEFEVGKDEIHSFMFRFNYLKNIVTISVDEKRVYHDTINLHMNKELLHEIKTKFPLFQLFYPIEIGKEEKHIVEVHLKSPQILGVIRPESWDFSVFLDDDIVYQHGKLLDRKKSQKNIHKQGIKPNEFGRMIVK